MLNRYALPGASVHLGCLFSGSCSPCVPMALRCPSHLGGQGAGAGEGCAEKQVKGCLWGMCPSWTVRVLRMAAAVRECPLLTLPFQPRSSCPVVYAHWVMFWGMH